MLLIQDLTMKLESLHFMSDLEPEPQEVLEFTTDEQDFHLSPKFVNDMKAANSPFVIAFIGNGRVGKSTRANQLIRRELLTSRPFESQSGTEPVTMKFQYVGPIPFSELGTIHKVSLAPVADQSIFIIDCEGLYSLGETTPLLKQATFALLQIASMVVLVVNDQVNFANGDDARAMLMLSHAFGHELPGFSVGTTIMIREVGVRTRPKEHHTFEQKNELRKKADHVQREKILSFLNQSRFSQETLLVLAQPEIETEDLYWKSIEDFLVFSGEIASKRSQISGEGLIRLFNEAKPIILRINDFNNPTIPFETIIGNMATLDLSVAYDEAIAVGEGAIIQYFADLPNASLRNGPNGQFIRDVQSRSINVFELKAEGSFLRGLDKYRLERENRRTLVQNTVQQRYDRRFDDQCLEILVPQIRSEVLETIKCEVKEKIDGQPITDVATFNFIDFAIRCETKARARFGELVEGIHPRLGSSVEFKNCAESLGAAIQSHVRDIESVRRRKYAAYIEAEARQRAAEEEARRRAELLRIEEEKRQKMEAERQEALRQEREKAERRRKEEEAAKAAQEAQLARLRAEEVARKVAEEKAAQVERERIEQVMREQAAAAECQRQEQARQAAAEAARQAELRAQAERLRAAPPPVVYVHHHHHGPCQVF
jgi:GTPase SAR1 family protein